MSNDDSTKDENQIITNLNNVFTKLTDYNKAYVCSKVSIQNDYFGNTNSDKQKECYPFTSASNANVGLLTANTILTTAITNLNTSIDNYKQKYLNGGGITDFDGSFNKLLEKKNNIVQLRNDLDHKLKEFYNMDNDSKISSLYENQPMVDSYVLSGMIWTIFATTMLYYVFVKL
jgi:hypothetical protein